MLVRCDCFGLHWCSPPLSKHCMLHCLCKLPLEWLEHVETHKNLWWFDESQSNTFMWSLMRGYNFWMVWRCGCKTLLRLLPRYHCSLYEENIIGLNFPLMWIKEVTHIHVSSNIPMLFLLDIASYLWWAILAKLHVGILASSSSIIFCLKTTTVWDEVKLKRRSLEHDMNQRKDNRLYDSWF